MGPGAAAITPDDLRTEVMRHRWRVGRLARERGSRKIVRLVRCARHSSNITTEPDAP